MRASQPSALTRTSFQSRSRPFTVSEVARATGPCQWGAERQPSSSVTVSWPVLTTSGLITT